MNTILSGMRELKQNQISQLFSIYSPLATYSQNAVVSYNGQAYQALQTSTGQTPLTATAFWQPLFNFTTTVAANIPFSIGGTNATITNVLAKLQESPSVGDYGLTACDGTHDGSQAAAAMAAAQTFLFVPASCTLRIATAMAISVPLYVATGGKINVDGVNFTPSVYTVANPGSAIFSLVNGGTVTFGNPQPRYPEWFGAVPNSSPAAATNTVAFNAAAAAGPGSLEVMGASYTLDSTFVDTTPKLHIVGRGDQATTLHLTNASADQFRAGIVSGGLVDMNGSLERILLVRDVAPGNTSLGTYPFVKVSADGTKDIINTTGAETAPALGVSLRNIVHFDVKNVHTYRSRIGFYQRSAANLYFSRELAEFNFAADAGDALGHYVDGQDDPYPFTGQTANASTTILDGGMFCGGNGVYGATASSTGLLIGGNFSDQWATNYQTSGGCNGIEVNGAVAKTTHVVAVANNGFTVGQQLPSGASSSTQQASFTNDLHITNPIIDGFDNFGLNLHDIPPNSPGISINDGYLLQNGGITAASIAITNANNVSIGGGLQAVAWFGGDADFCISMSNARQIHIDGSVKLLDCGYPVNGTQVVASEISPTILNHDNKDSARSAITLANSSLNRIAPSIDAFNANGPVSGAFSTGVYIVGGTAGAGGTNASPGNVVDLTKVPLYTGASTLNVDGAITSGGGHFGTSVGAAGVLITGPQP